MGGDGDDGAGDGDGDDGVDCCCDGDDEDEDGRYNDGDVDDHLDSLMVLVQLDGGDEVDEEGGNDGQSTAREEDELKDLQHLSVVQVVVDVSLEAGGEVNGCYKSRGDQD